MKRWSPTIFFYPIPPRLVKWIAGVPARARRPRWPRAAPCAPSRGSTPPARGGPRRAGSRCSRPPATSRVLATQRQRKTAAREEAVDAGAPVLPGRQLAETPRFQGEAGREPFGQAHAHHFKDGGGRGRSGHGSVVGQQPGDLGIALDVRKRQRGAVGERREEDAAELTGH